MLIDALVNIYYKTTHWIVLLPLLFVNLKEKVNRYQSPTTTII